MSDKLKRFISKHRKEFDTSEPAKEVWEKIDSRIGVKAASRISSNWLSKYKYLGFSASVLVVVVYFITRGLNDPYAIEPVPGGSDSSAKRSEQFTEPYEFSSGTDPRENKETMRPQALVNDKAGFQDAGGAASNKAGRQNEKDQHSRLAGKTDSVINMDGLTRTGDSVYHNRYEPEDPVPGSQGAKSEIGKAGIPKKANIYMPEEPEKMNTYTGTLYDGASLCAVLRAYKFPGRVKIDKGGGIFAEDVNYRTTIVTISCGRLENVKNIKAVWLKGKTDKEFIITVKKRFKNIKLVKRDGKEIDPEAISHYYPGRGVISQFKGVFFNMIFKDKVELILFFKDAEEGDKIVIDGALEAVVKGKP